MRGMSRKGEEERGRGVGGGGEGKGGVAKLLFKFKKPERSWVIQASK